MTKVESYISILERFPTLKNVCGSHFQAGARYVNEDCSEVCSCNEGQLDCTPYGCGDFATCRVKNGVRDCYCQNGFKGDGQVCFRG